LLSRAGIRPIPLPHRVVVHAALLPGALHGDPADRLLIATARELDVPIVTRDHRILDHAAQGHLQAIAC
jgi:PIN domain nuclease of toxin-antitoxin system